MIIMANNKFRLRIITPTEVKIDEEVEMVVVRCTTGEMGIMANHESWSMPLDYGIARISGDDSEDSEERRIAIFGGFAVVHENVMTITTPGAEFPKDIDLAQAEADRDSARRDLQEKTDKLEIQSIQLKLKRSLIEIEASQSISADNSTENNF